MEKLAILLVEEQASSEHARGVVETLRTYDQPFELTRVSALSDFRVCLASRPFDVILCGSCGPIAEQAVRAARAMDPHLPIIFICDANDPAIFSQSEVAPTEWISRTNPERIMPAIRRAVAEARNRSRHQRAEQQLRESEQRWHLLTETIPQIIWTSSAHGRFTYVNRRWYEYTGRTREQTLGEAWQEAFHQDDRHETLTRWLRRLSDGRPQESELRLRSAQGVYQWHRLTALPIFTDSGQISQWVGAITNVDDLKQASDAKDRFLAVLSHELRTPLSPVMLAISDLEAVEGLAPTIRDDIATIRRNIELETRLIDDLLDLSRVVSGKLRMNIETCDVHELLEHVVRMLAGEYRDKRLDVAMHLDAAVHLVRGDAARLQQVFWNLIKNAIKFTPEGGRITIRSSEAPGQIIRIIVSDSGIGIASERLTKIFEPFEQGSSRIAGQYGGMGLGLSISKAIVDAHRGTIAASTEGPGRGASFHVELPLTLKSKTVDAAQPSQPAVDSGGGNVRVLLVEDHLDTARLLLRCLRQWGYHATHATSLADARRCADTSPFSFVISDLGLPDGSGHELMRLLHRQHGLSGIAISGFGMDEDVRRSREYGFAEHLVKPISPPQLRAAIGRLLAGCSDTICSRA